MPISALNRSDADITILFLSANQVLYPLPASSFMAVGQEDRAKLWYHR